MARFFHGDYNSEIANCAERGPEHKSHNRPGDCLADASRAAGVGWAGHLLSSKPIQGSTAAEWPGVNVWIGHRLNAAAQKLRVLCRGDASAKKSPNRFPPEDRASLLGDHRAACAPGMRLLVSMRDAEQRGFGEWLANELHGHGQPIDAQTGADRYRGKPRQGSWCGQRRPFEHAPCRHVRDAWRLPSLRGVYQHVEFRHRSCELSTNSRRRRSACT